MYSPAALPSRNRQAEAKNRQLSLVRSISNSTMPTGLPTFSHSMRDSSSMLSSITSATRCRISLRSRGVSADHAGNASDAARTAASTSAASLAGTSPIDLPGRRVEDLVRGATGGRRQSPPMKLEFNEERSDAIDTDCHVRHRTVTAA
jgi:hypothetical protein